MRPYETTFIVAPQLTDAELKDLLEKTKKLITQEKGEITGEVAAERRKLAHPIGKHREASYLQLRFNADGRVLERLMHHYRVTDSVIRFMTVVVKVKAPKPVVEKEKKAVV